MTEKARFSSICVLLIIGYSKCVNVHFENKDGGFFIKQQPRQHYWQSVSDLGGKSVNAGVPLSIDRFTVFQSSQPISVRATYGPFSTKQTVPARYVVPDPLPLNTSVPAIDLQDQATHHLDMSAHIVRNEIPRDSPILRVLFHTGTDPGGRRQVLLARHHQRVCIVLHATMGAKTPLYAACSPDGEDGVCLAQVTVPSFWWPPLPSPEKDGRPGKLTKTPPRLVQIAYSVLEPWPDEGEGCHPKMQVQPSVVLGNVPLVPAKGAYKELKLTDAITMLVPHPPLFPMSRMHIPVFIDRQKAKMLTAIVIRARVKSGVRLLTVIPAGANAWNVTIDINPRQIGASITLVRREPPDTETATKFGEIMELFTWLIEIMEDASDIYDGAKIVWTARFEPHQDESDNAEVHKTEGKKSTSRFEIQKDDIQAVVPISKNWEVLNTAVLTGQQVSQTMKVFIVSQAGKAADVTFQASCHSEDESVLKVSSSCGSVYVDGSEARGSVNGSVLVKYGTYTGLAQFTVWMPEFPLELAVADTRLSQLKSWRVPDYHVSTSKSKRKKRSYGNAWSVGGPNDMGTIMDKQMCRLRYQQTSVDVYAHFFATDHQSGRTTYLINRRTWLRVTDLVLPWLRVSDPRIASLQGRILQGRSMGRTEVQVLSPITSRVYGSKEIRVGNEKVEISKLLVQVVSGLQLNISPDSSLENVYVAETGITRKLTAQYQEGLLDVELEFSDGSKTPLRDISDTDYHLVVESVNPEVVAFAPMIASHHPRVIAVGEGSGDLLHVTLLLAEECRSSGGRLKMKAVGPLATTDTSIIVDFSSSDLSQRPDILQNDGGSYVGSKVEREFPDLQDILKGTPFKDEKSQEPNVQARQYQGNNKGISRKYPLAHIPPLEISMYVLLAAFCCAIVVFVVSCVVYASKYKTIERSITANVKPSAINSTSLVIPRVARKSKESTTNVHDWVWLGRATLDSSNRNSTTTNNNSIDMRIINNPLNSNYCEPGDCLPATSFRKTNDMQLLNSTETNANMAIDSNTYCKSKVGGGTYNASENADDVQVWNKPTPPPLPLSQGFTPLLHETGKIIQNESDDYRPPIPPHRNIGITENRSSPEVTIPRKLYHHHHHRNKNEDKGNQSRLSGKFNPGESLNSNNVAGDLRNSEMIDKKESHVFEFDDEPQTITKDEIIEFVQYPGSPNSICKRHSTDVKRATIVGNPMFSSNVKNGDIANNTSSDLPNLDDLQLDMDYDQIMLYFESLKESNA